MIFSQPLTAARPRSSFSAFTKGWTELRVSFTTFYLNSFIIAGLAVIGNLSACSLTAFAFARLISGAAASGSR